MGKSSSSPALDFGHTGILTGVHKRRTGGTPPGVLGCLVDDVVRDERFGNAGGYRSAVLSHKKLREELGGSFGNGEQQQQGNVFQQPRQQSITQFQQPRQQQQFQQQRQQQQQQQDSGFFSPIVRRQQPGLQRGMVASQSTPILGYQNLHHQQNQQNQQQQEIQFVHTLVSSRDSTPPAYSTYLNASAQRSEELMPIKGPAFTAKFGHHDPVPRKRKNLGLDFSGGMNFISREQAAYIT